MKFREPFRPKTRKISPARYRAIAEAFLLNRVLLLDWQPFRGVTPLEVNTIDDVYFLEIQVFL